MSSLATLPASTKLEMVMGTPAEQSNLDNEGSLIDSWTLGVMFEIFLVQSKGNRDWEEQVWGKDQRPGVVERQGNPRGDGA